MANKPELIRYIPSGKYPPNAPVIFILSLFSFSVLTAWGYGYGFGLLFGDLFELLYGPKDVWVMALFLAMMAGL